MRMQKTLWKELSPGSRKTIARRAATLGVTLVEGSISANYTFSEGVQFYKGVLTVEPRAEIDAVIHDIGHAFGLKKPNEFKRSDSDMNTPEDIAMVVQTCLGYRVPGVRPVDRMQAIGYTFAERRISGNMSGRTWWNNVRFGRGSPRERITVRRLKKAGIWPL